METSDPNLDPSLNEELCGITPEDLVYQIPNNEFNHLHRHTYAYLQYIGQIPIVYQIPRDHSSHGRTQPYGENKTLDSSIDDLIIDTASEIKQPITTIPHFANQEYPKLQNLLDFHEVDSTFYDFLEAEAGGFGPPEPPKTNPTCTNPLSPRLNFNFIANMEANRPWLAMDSIAVPSAQHPLPKHPKKLLSKFDPDNEVTPEDHIKQFLIPLILTVLQHEDVVCRLFPYTFVGQDSTWFFSLAARSIASWKQFEIAFLS